jgi:sodium/potassium-transporting ATPase subunit alpha
MFIKGAPDVLLPRCTSVILSSGERVPLTPSLHDDLTNLQSRWSTNAQRVLILTRRVIPSYEIDVKELESPESPGKILRKFSNELVIVSMIGIVDAPRADIPEVVRICRGGGIRLIHRTKSPLSTE